MNKSLTVAQLVSNRKNKELNLKNLQAEIKIVRREIKQLNKKIQENLNEFIISGEINTEISPNTFGYDYKIKEQMEKEAKEAKEAKEENNVTLFDWVNDAS